LQTGEGRISFRKPFFSGRRRKKRRKEKEEEEEGGGERRLHAYLLPTWCLLVLGQRGRGLKEKSRRLYHLYHSLLLFCLMQLATAEHAFAICQRQKGGVKAYHASALATHLAMPALRCLAYCLPHNKNHCSDILYAFLPVQES